MERQRQMTRVLTFADSSPAPDLPLKRRSRPTTAASDNSEVALVIDNGAFHCRVGFVDGDQPDFVFPSLVHKQRGQKDWEAQVGNDIGNLDAVRWHLKSPFEQNVVTQFDVQEQILDHAFRKLSIEGEGCVPHPLVMTEPLGNPNFCRQQMNEILFETYDIPSVAWGIDAMFSFHANHPSAKDGFIVSLGSSDISLLPLLDGAITFNHVRRISIGGRDLVEALQKTLVFKYPVSQSHFSLGRCEEILHSQCRIASHYGEEINDWKNENYYQQNVIKYQLPPPPTMFAAKEAETRQKREQQAERMRQMAAKRKNEEKKRKTQKNNKIFAELEREQEKLASERSRLRHLELVREKEPSRASSTASRGGAEEEFEVEMANLGFTTNDQLQAAIAKLKQKINKLKDVVKNLKTATVSASHTGEAENRCQNFDLLKIPDDQLTETQMAAKKKQVVLHRMHQGRLRAKELREQKKNIDSRETRRLDEKRKIDFKSWLNEMRKRRTDLLASKARRQKRRTDMAKRHSLAAQKRMKIITELARGSGNIKKMKDDSFGSRDEDWNVYKEIDLEGGDSESEEENEKLDKIESVLKEFDHEFAVAASLGTCLRRMENYQIEIGVECIRIPEIIFQPTAILGLGQMGLSECAESVLGSFSASDQQRLVDNFFLTGGLGSLPGIEERIRADMTSFRPFGSSLSISRASSPSLDAWRGAALWARDPEIVRRFSITKRDFLEMGGDYLKENSALSNPYIKFQKS